MTDAVKKIAKLVVDLHGEKNTQNIIEVAKAGGKESAEAVLFKKLTDAIIKDMTAMINHGDSKEKMQFTSTEQDLPMAEDTTLTNNKLFWFSVVVGIVLFVTAINYLLDKVCWIKAARKIAITCFLISVCWNYINIYEKTMAKRYMVIRQGIPGGCMERGADWSTVLRTMFKTLMITHSDSNDECLQYAKSIIVEPLFEVTPTTALATTISDLILVPINLAAKSCNNVFRTVFEGVPVFMIPILVFLLVYISTLCIISTKRYTISVPFLLELKPCLVKPPPMVPISVRNETCNVVHKKPVALRRGLCYNKLFRNKKY